MSSDRHIPAKNPGIEPDITLDVTGHKCPLPVLRVRRILDQMPAGNILRVMATDSMTQIDLPYFCQQGGHDVLEMTRKDNIYYFLIKKAGA